MRIRVGVLALALLLPASLSFAQVIEEFPGHAAGTHEDAHVHHGGAIDVGEIFRDSEFQGAVVNFLLLAFIFGWVIRKKVTPFLVERRRQVVESLEEAKRIKEAAEAKHKEYTDRLAKLDEELDQIRKDMVKAGEAERDRIVADAEKKAASLRRETDFLISQRIKELRKELHREAIEAAIATATKVLQEKTTAEDQTRLAQSYLGAIAGTKSSGGARESGFPRAAEKKEKSA